MCAVQESLPAGYPIRLSADQWICAPPRGFSQLITAFIASRLQGIRRGPMLRLTILPLPPRVTYGLPALKRALKKSLAFPYRGVSSLAAALFIAAADVFLPL